MSQPDFLQLSFMNIDRDGITIKVQICDYVEAKTKDLQEFGYKTLTEESVLNSVRRVLNREKLVDVIDRFVEHDIVLDEEKKD